MTQFFQVHQQIALLFPIVATAGLSLMIDYKAYNSMLRLMLSPPVCILSENFKIIPFRI